MEMHQSQGKRYYSPNRKDKTVLCIDVSALKDVVDAFADLQPVQVNQIQPIDVSRHEVMSKKI